MQGGAQHTWEEFSCTIHSAFSTYASQLAGICARLLCVFDAGSTTSGVTLEILLEWPSELSSFSHVSPARFCQQRASIDIHMLTDRLIHA